MDFVEPVRCDEIFEHRRGGFLISTDRGRLDLDIIHGFLTNCYWARGVPREVVARSIEHSLCFGIYDEASSDIPGLATTARPGAPRFLQIGFARVISDFATFAYLGDVFVLESHRGQGLGKWLMQCIVSHPLLQGLRCWVLRTRDAHGLYQQVGFTPVPAPELYMELYNPDVYEVGKSK